MLIFRAASTPLSVSVMSSPLNVRLQSSDISFFTANQPAVYTAVFWLAQATRSARRWRAIYLRSVEEKVYKPLFRTETRTFGEKVRRPRGQTTYLIWCLIGCHNTADGLPEWLNKPLGVLWLCVWGLPYGGRLLNAKRVFECSGCVSQLLNISFLLSLHLHQNTPRPPQNLRVPVQILTN